MHYAIIRHAKLKSLGSLAASAQHTFRERYTPNADSSRTHLNRHLYAQNSAEVVQRLKEKLPQKVRKNGVLAIEYFIGASPQWWDQVDEKQKNEFFKRSLQWLQDRHGKENVIYFGSQMDESSPHAVAYIIPLDAKGKLNAAHFLDGKEKLRKYQSSFAKCMKDLGLERGIEGSNAKHERVKRFYSLVNSEEKMIEKPGILHKIFGTRKAKTYEVQIESLNQKLLDFEARKKKAEIQANALTKKEADITTRELKFSELEAENFRLRSILKESELKKETEVDALKRQLRQIESQNKAMQVRLTELSVRQSKNQALGSVHFREIPNQNVPK